MDRQTHTSATYAYLYPLDRHMPTTPPVRLGHLLALSIDIQPPQISLFPAWILYILGTALRTQVSLCS